MRMSRDRKTPELSKREEEILGLAASGQTDKIIAEALGLSLGTINDYWTRIRRKLGAASRTEAVAVHAAKATAQLQEERRSLLGELAERKRVEEALRMSEEAMRALIERALEGIVVSENGRIVFVNQHLQRLTGYSARDLIGQETSFFVKRDPRGEKAYRGHLELLASGRDIRFEFLMPAKDGRILWFLASVAQYQGPGGIPARVSVLTDITEFKAIRDGLAGELSDGRRESEGLQAALSSSDAS